MQNLSLAVRRISSGILVAAAAAGLHAQGADGHGAASLASIAPADVFAYVSFAGLDASNAAVEKLGLWQLWREPQVQTFFKPLVERYAQAAAQMPEQGVQHWNQVKQLLGGRISIIVGGFNLVWERDEPRPMPGVVLALDVGAHAQEIRGLFDQMLQHMEQQLPMTRSTTEHAGFDITVIEPHGPMRVGLYATFADNLLLVGLNRPLLFQCLDNLAGAGAGKHGATLAALPAFERARSKPKAAPLVEVFLGVATLASRLGGLLPDEWRAALHDLGVDGIDAIYYASAVHDGDSFDTFFVGAPAPRRGLLAADTKPLSAETLEQVPPTAAYTTAFHFDLAKSWDALWSAAEQVLPPAATAHVKNHLEQVHEHLGFDIRRDLIGGLGKEMVAYVDLPANSMVPMVVASVKVSDAARIEKVLAGLLGAARVETRDVRYQEQTLHMIQLPGNGVPLTPSYALVDDRLVCSLTLAGLRAAVSTKREGSLAQQPDFKATFEGLDVEHASCIEYLDVKRLASYGYSLIESIVPGAPEHVIPLDLTEIPARETVLAHLEGFGTVGQEDDDGIVYQSRTLGLASILALGSAFLERAAGIPPAVLEQLAPRPSPRLHVAQRRPSPSPIPQDRGDQSGGKDEIDYPAAAPNILNPVKAGDPRAKQLEKDLSKLDQQVEANPDQGDLYFKRGLVRSQLSKFDAAVEDYEKARELGNSATTAAYNIACARSLQGRAQDAMKWLQTALKEGFRDWAVLDHDSDLDPIRKDPRFEELLRGYRQ